MPYVTSLYPLAPLVLELPHLVRRAPYLYLSVAP